MALKEATIRYRIDARGAASDVERFTKTFNVQARIWEDLNRKYQQGLAGGLPPQQLSGLRTSMDMLKKHGEATWGLRQRAIDQQTRAELGAAKAAAQEKIALRQKADEREIQQVIRRNNARFRAEERAAKEELRLAATTSVARQRIESRPGVGMAGGGRMSGRWQPGGYKTPSFGSMSDRFTAMFTVGNVISDITGDKPMGREIGLAASGFLLGSPLFASINAAAVAFGMYARITRENAEAFRKRQADFNTAMEEAGKALVQPDTTAIGQQVRSRMEALKKYDKTLGEESRGQSIAGMVGPETGWGERFMNVAEQGFRYLTGAKGMEEHRSDIEKKRLVIAKTISNFAAEEARQEEISTRRREAGWKRELEALAIDNMRNGVEKERLKLLAQEKDALADAAAKTEDNPYLSGLVDFTRKAGAQRLSNFNAQADRDISDMLTKMADRISLAQSRMPWRTQREIARREFEKELDAKNVTGYVRRGSLRQFDTAADAEKAREVKDALASPVVALRRLADELGANKELTPKQRADYLDRQLNQATKQDTGRFMDPASRWRDIQSKLLQKDDTPKMTLKEIQEMKEEIKRLRSGGITIKAG